MKLGFQKYPCEKKNHTLICKIIIIKGAIGIKPWPNLDFREALCDEIIAKLIFEG